MQLQYLNVYQMTDRLLAACNKTFSRKKNPKKHNAFMSTNFNFYALLNIDIF